MTRVNFREIRDRFTHIDAKFESCAISIPGKSHYAVRLYPWWENPKYLELMESGAYWEVSSPTDAAKVVTVYPVRLRQACLRDTDEIIDWAFIDSSHVLLWEYETEEQILCKTALPLGSLQDLPSKIADALPYRADPPSISSLFNDGLWKRREIAESGRGGFSLGRFPTSVAGAVRSVLAELGVGYLEEDPPPAQKLPVMLLIDETDYLIAEDFEVDIPDFTHSNDWVTDRR